MGLQKQQAIALLKKAAQKGYSLQDFSIDEQYLRDIVFWRHLHALPSIIDNEIWSTINITLGSMGVVGSKSISLWTLASGFAKDDVLSILKASPNGDYETPAYQMSAQDQKQAKQLAGRYQAISVNTGQMLDELTLSPQGNFELSWFDGMRFGYKGQWWVEKGEVVLKSDPSQTAPAWKVSWGQKHLDNSNRIN